MWLSIIMYVTLSPVDSPTHSFSVPGDDFRRVFHVLEETIPILLSMFSWFSKPTTPYHVLPCDSERSVVRHTLTTQEHLQLIGTLIGKKHKKYVRNLSLS